MHEILLASGAKVNAKNDEGWTALMLAAYWGDVESFQILLEAGANLDIVNHNGHTALILAEILGKTEIIRLIRVS